MAHTTEDFKAIMGFIFTKEFNEAQDKLAMPGMNAARFLALKAAAIRVAEALEGESQTIAILTLCSRLTSEVLKVVFDENTPGADEFVNEVKKLLTKGE